MRGSDHRIRVPLDIVPEVMDNSFHKRTDDRVLPQVDDLRRDGPEHAVMFARATAAGGETGLPLGLLLMGSQPAAAMISLALAMKRRANASSTNGRCSCATLSRLTLSAHR